MRSLVSRFEVVSFQSFFQLIIASIFDTAIFKLKAQNVAFFALAPYFFSKYCYQQAICDRVDNLWRIHQNRERKGLGGTNNSMQMYEEGAGHN